MITDYAKLDEAIKKGVTAVSNLDTVAGDYMQSLVELARANNYTAFTISGGKYGSPGATTGAKKGKK